MSSRRGHPRVRATRRQARRLAPAVVAALCLAAGAAAADEHAIDRLTRGLAAAEAQDGKTSPYLLPVIEELAQAQLRDGALRDAAGLRRRALDIAIGAFGCDAASAGEAMAALAVVAIDRRRYLDGEPLLVIAERVLAGRISPDHPTMAAIFAGRARIALARGDKAPAEAWARRAVDIARKNPHNRSTEPLRALGAVLAAAERFDEAGEVLDEALAADRKHHGAEGAEGARSLAALAALALRRGRAAEALPLIEEAMAIDQARLGRSHPFIADDFYDLGLAYAALERSDDAQRAFTAALAVLEHGAGRDTPRVAYTETELSRLYRAAGNDAAAEAAFHDARRILNRAEREEHEREREI